MKMRICMKDRERESRKKQDAAFSTSGLVVPECPAADCLVG